MLTSIKYGMVSNSSNNNIRKFGRTLWLQNIKLHLNVCVNYLFNSVIPPDFKLNILNFAHAAFFPLPTCCSQQLVLHGVVTDYVSGWNRLFSLWGTEVNIHTFKTYITFSPLISSFVIWVWRVKEKCEVYFRNKFKVLPCINSDSFIRKINAQMSWNNGFIYQIGLSNETYFEAVK